MDAPLVIDAPDPEATRAFGRRLARALSPNLVVALVGPLGAGKTHLARAVAEGLNIDDPSRVTSPTFVLIQEYPTEPPLYHFDAYRLGSPDEFYDLGAHEYFDAGGVCLVEWADRVAAALPADVLRIAIQVTGATSRRFTVEATGEQSRDVLRKLSSEVLSPPPAAGEGN
jgi:tRNA threonylcarbamoyladenosine biosynthesis protein TsaE